MQTLSEECKALRHRTTTPSRIRSENMADDSQLAEATQALSFAEFLERMKDPQAANLVRSIKKCVVHHLSTWLECRIICRYADPMSRKQLSLIHDLSMQLHQDLRRQACQSGQRRRKRAGESSVERRVSRGH